MRPVLLIPLAAALAVSILAWLNWRHSQQLPLAVSGFIEADEVRVGSRVGGRVAETLVQEGRRVTPGELLLRIDPFDLGQRLAQAQALLAANNAELSRLQAGFRPEEIEQARAKRDRASATLDKLVAGSRRQEIEITREQVKIAQANFDFARSEHVRLTRLHAEQQAAITEVDLAVRQLSTAQAALAIAQQELALREEGTRPEDIAEARAALAEAQHALQVLEQGYRAEEITRAQAQVAAAESQVAALTVQLGELDVISPCDCVVEAVDLHPGDLVSANAPALSLLDLSRLWVRAYVPEARLAEIKLGQQVSVVVDSVARQKFAGRISFIAREAEFTPRNVQTPEERSKQVFRIKVMLEGDLDPLWVGMSADVLLAPATQP